MIAEKAHQAPSGSPERYRLLEMLQLPDEALLDTIYSHIEPNPKRVGCPPRETLRELAMRTRPLNDPWWDHIMTCSPCRIDVREMGRDRPVTAARPAPHFYGWPAAAVLLLAIGIAGGWWFMRPSGAGTAITGDLRQYALMRSDRPEAGQPAFDLPQRRVRLTLMLPNGSEPGPYRLEVRSANGGGRATATGTATLQDFITRLEITVDLSSVPRGLSEVAIRRDGEDWQLFPVRIQ